MIRLLCSSAGVQNLLTRLCSQKATLINLRTITTNATKSVGSEGSRNKELGIESSVGTQVSSLALPTFSISELSDPLDTQPSKRRTKLAHDVEALTEHLFPPKPRYVYRVHYHGAATKFTQHFSQEKPGQSSFSYTAAGFDASGRRYPTTPRVSGNNHGNSFQFSNEFIGFAVAHSDKESRVPSPFIATSTDLLRVFSTARRHAPYTQGISVVDLSALPEDRYWRLDTILKDYESRKIERCNYLSQEDYRAAYEKQWDITKTAAMKITEIVVWKEIPPSAILAHWSWSKITNPMLTGWDEGWLPGLCGYDKVTDLREYLLSRSTMQSEKDEWAVLKVLNAFLPLDWRNDGRKLEFFLHLAVKMLGYKRGLGVKTESDCRHAWPEGLNRVAVMMRLAEEMEKLWRQGESWLTPPSKRPPGIQLDQSASHLERVRSTI